jgi:hypothetical protein
MSSGTLLGVTVSVEDEDVEDEDDEEVDREGEDGRKGSPAVSGLPVSSVDVE